MNKATIKLMEDRIVAYDERMKGMIAYADEKATAIAHSQIEIAIGLAYELGKANGYQPL